MIYPSLIDAVTSCTAAAGHEYSIHWQKQLLKAASFGKTVLDLFDSDDFVAMTEILRVLNAVRSHEIGLPLSYDQYIWLGPERLVERLINRREYALALRISQYLALPTSIVYSRWAMQKVKIGTEDDDTICKAVVTKVSGQSGISFEEIARAAQEEGRHHLATQILNYETRAGKQVPLLLAMEEDTIALDKAIDSGDTDLILYVLLHMKAKVPLATFFRTINSRPVATALFESTALAQDRELLKDLYYQDDRRLEGSHLLIQDALEQFQTDAKASKLRSANKLIQDTKEYAFQSRSIEELQRLLKLQDSLDADKDLALPTEEGAASRPRFQGLSLNQTISTLIASGAHKRALKVAQDFKLSDRTFWQVRLRALVASRQWREVESIAANTKKSPIGWEVFYNDCLAAGKTQLAGVFVAKCTDKTSQERCDMYEKCGMVVKAAEEAHKSKDRARLEDLRGRASGRDLVEIERLIGLLTKR